ncbi:uncharacterized protein BO80DRAFT_431688 [Aspergillus ibericus CBS 121593]|uniref:Uncharacterized protein n=1 Tax=Aspergillus ibericus CBS 121593 TaxID=1448316 RepID=A0A395HB39_9EURO|nr:hypothetical protein BO80DRAFT_431688 [Aspergillus ibericus CBS 121593]RAL05161.1 hypothetical protein BO80DRAFT_431688 [Aspergillus ibericus CBS 121593]
MAPGYDAAVAKDTQVLFLDKSQSRMPEADYKFKNYHGMTIALGRILDIQTRKNSCFLCASVATLVLREGNIDQRLTAYLKIIGAFFPCSSIYVEGENGSRAIDAPLYRDSYSLDAAKMPDFTLDCSVGDIGWLTVQKWVKESPEDDRSSELPDGKYKPVEVVSD